MPHQGEFIWTLWMPLGQRLGRKCLKEGGAYTTGTTEGLTLPKENPVFFKDSYSLSFQVLFVWVRSQGPGELIRIQSPLSAERQFTCGIVSLRYLGKALKYLFLKEKPREILKVSPIC